MTPQEEYYLTEFYSVEAAQIPTIHIAGQLNERFQSCLICGCNLFDHRIFDFDPEIKGYEYGSKVFVIDNYSSVNPIENIEYKKCI